MTTTLVCPICGARWKMVPAQGDWDLPAECPVCIENDGAAGVREPAPDRPRNPGLEGETHAALPYPRRRETRACADCGEAIQPGQIYLPGEPLHVYCGRRERGLQRELGQG